MIHMLSHDSRNSTIASANNCNTNDNGNGQNRWLMMVTHLQLIIVQL